MSLIDPVILSGARLVEVALRHGLARPVELVVLRGGSSRGLARLVADAESKRVPVRFVDAAELDRMESRDVALALGPRETATLESALSASPARALVLALEGVEDPHNLGAILRAAAAFGANAAVLDRHAREMPRDVVARASAGASECLAIVFADDLSRALDGLRALDVECVAATADDATSAFEMQWPARACLVIGGERRGLSRATLDACPRRVTIPMAPTVDSLPAVVSASALLFAFARQQRQD
jgi:23S rRNA (guanosine2251-2'-O)-methyltransferase